MSREQQRNWIKQLEAVQQRIVEGKPLSREDRIACWYGMQARINSMKEHLYGMGYIWDQAGDPSTKKYAPKGYIEDKIASESKPCPLGETPEGDAR
jgi:hypothetical protein